MPRPRPAEGGRLHPFAGRFAGTMPIGVSSSGRSLRAVYKSLRNGVAFILLAAAAVGTWYWSRVPEPRDVAGFEAGAHPAGYYLRDAVLLGTDNEGRVLYRIDAELAEELPQGEGLMLNGVEVKYQPSEEVPWRVRAARAKASSGQSYLQLEGDVELERQTAEGERTLVQTESLRLEPEQYVATASGQVRFSVNGSTLEAVGLKAFLKDDRLELESEVHGRLLP